MIKRSTLSLATALLLGACAATGQHYTPPDTAAVTWKNAALLPADAGQGKTDLARWWQTLNDPALNRLIETALAQNYDLKTAQAKLRESRARAGMTDAALYPSLNASLGAKRTETSNNISKSFSAGLDASWELDIFGANRSNSESAEATAAASEASLHDAEVSLVAEVANLYIALRTLEARSIVARNSLASQQETRDLTQWRAQAGLVSEVETLQADSALAQTRASLPALDKQIETTRNQLAVLLGQTPAALPPLLEGAGQVPDFAPVTTASIPLDTLRQRPDLRAAERRVAAQAAQISVANAARFPKLSLSGAISLQSDQLGQLLRADSLVNSLAANLTAPIFDAGRIRQNIAVQNAVFDQTLAAYEKSLLQALADVENALMALAKTEVRRTELDKANTYAIAADSLARQRYAAGLADYLTVLETQRTLLSIQDSLRSANGDRATALVQLYKALGGGWTAPAVNPSPEK